MVSFALVGAATVAESNILYDLRQGYIDLTKISIDIQETDSYVPFEDSIGNLKNEMAETGATGASNTSIYFENEEDQEENVLRVDIDFSGNTLAQPVNTMLVIDQSGSMNMIASKKVGLNSFPSYQYTSPCLHSNHLYKFPITIDGINYNYYHFPSESDWTGDWSGRYGSKSIILAEIKEHAISEGVATASSTIAISNTYFWPSNSASQLNHYDYTGEGDRALSNRVYIDEPVADEEKVKREEEVKNFTKIENSLFLKENTTSNEEFYSPYVLNLDISAKEYFDNLDASGLCYDRMMVSKSIFDELGEQALVNTGNKIGYANFARYLEAYQDLSENELNSEFANTVGTGGTYYLKGLDKAKEEFLKPENAGNQNLLIFSTDGIPNDTSASAISVYMQDFVEQTGAIVYFVGIDLNDTLFTSWGSAIATTDSNGDKNMSNSRSVEELLLVQRELEKILTTTNELNTFIKDDFNLEISGDHKMVLEYKIKEETTSTKVEMDSLDDLALYGITYDKDTKEISWDMGSAGITSARLSFYKQFDAENIDWEAIEAGGSQEGVTLGDTGIGYIDYSGVEQHISMDDTATYHIEENSKLTIENTTSTAYDVVYGQEINYHITVKNTGVLTSENNYVYQKLPEGTKYSSSPGGTYDEATGVITYEIPVLSPGEELTFSYTAIADAYDFEIMSQARLGVYEQSVTYDEEAVPYLAAAELLHKSAKQIISPDPDTDPELSPPVDSGENTQESEIGQIGVSTGDNILLFALGITGVSFMALLMVLLLRKRVRL